MTNFHQYKNVKIKPFLFLVVFISLGIIFNSFLVFAAEQTDEVLIQESTLSQESQESKENTEMLIEENILSPEIKTDIEVSAEKIPTPLDIKKDIEVLKENIASSEPKEDIENSMEEKPALEGTTTPSPTNEEILAPIDTEKETEILISTTENAVNSKETNEYQLSDLFVKNSSQQNELIEELAKNPIPNIENANDVLLDKEFAKEDTIQEELQTEKENSENILPEETILEESEEKEPKPKTEILKERRIGDLRIMKILTFFEKKDDENSDQSKTVELWMDNIRGDNLQKIATEDMFAEDSIFNFYDNIIFWFSKKRGGVSGLDITSQAYFSQTIETQGKTIMEYNFKKYDISVKNDNETLIISQINEVD